MATTTQITSVQVQALCDRIAQKMWAAGKEWERLFRMVDDEDGRDVVSGVDGEAYTRHQARLHTQWFRGEALHRAWNRADALAITLRERERVAHGKALAVKCFVYACNWYTYGRVECRTAWLLRGLRLWQEATGEDMRGEMRNVLRTGGMRVQFLRDAYLGKGK